MQACPQWTWAGSQRPQIWSIQSHRSSGAGPGARPEACFQASDLYDILPTCTRCTSAFNIKDCYAACTTQDLSLRQLPSSSCRPASPIDSRSKLKTELLFTDELVKLRSACSALQQIAGGSIYYTFKMSDELLLSMCISHGSMRSFAERTATQALSSLKLPDTYTSCRLQCMNIAD